MDDEKKKRLEDAGWKVGDADEFLEDIMKPKHLSQIEEHYKDSARSVVFDNMFGGEWMVDIQGCFADFELHEIVKALRAVNKAGKL